MLFRHSDNEFLLTCAEPNVGYLRDLVGRLQVEIEDVSDQHGILAVQGPRSREILQLLAPEVTDLPFFGLVNTKIGKAPVTISRTGYTGDLGYEINVPADDALERARRADQGRNALRHAGFRRGSPADGAHRGRPGADQRRVPLQPLRVQRLRAGDRQGARLRLDAQGHRRRRPAVHRPRRDPPRGQEQDLALGHRRAAPRLAGLEPALQRGRPDPAQGRDAARLRVDVVRRQGCPGRLRDVVDVLPDAAAAHRPRAGARPSSPSSAPRSTSSSRSTTTTRRSRPT